jgi:HipA-like protein
VATAAKLSRVLEPLRRVTATRYVAPLREGGSLPGLLEADDDGMYVTKFSGAGQGAGALVAEVLAGELARALGLPVPELVVIDVPPELGHAEPDPEIQELIAASPGPNLGMDFLPGSLAFTVPPDPPVDPRLAADVVWFDTLVTNVDRTHRNPNLVVWGGRTWLIDHGASFFRQHGPRALAETAHDGMPMLADHVLLPYAGAIRDADARLASRALAAVGGAVALVPSAWLGVNPASRRGDLAAFLSSRLAAPRRFVDEIERARG